MTRSRIILPKPHSVKQQLIMESLVMQGLVEMFVSCGTKFGKSIGASGAITTRQVTGHGLLGRWVAPIYAQTKIGFKYCKKILPPPPHTRVDNHDLSLTMNMLDSRVEFKSGKFPEDLEGEGIHGGYVLDECAKMQQQVYDSAKTTVTVTRAPILAISTPRGKNWFYTKCMAAKDEMEWAIKKGLPPAKIFLTAASIDNPLVSAEAVEEARRSMPDRLFRQYYLAEFVDDGSVFLGYRDCLFGDELDLHGPSQRWFDPDYDGNTVVIGADWAKTQDYTVFTAFDIVTRKLAGFQRFHKTPYTEAIRKLVLFARKFKDVIVVKHDKTGLGGVIDDQLSYTELPYEGVTFTNAWKADAVTSLITSVEHKMIGLPRWPEMIDEFESYEVSTSAAGNLSYAAVPGKHDDIVSSLLLSHQALLQYSDSGADIKFMEDLKNPEPGRRESKDAQPQQVSPIEQFYRSISEDDDD